MELMLDRGTITDHKPGVVPKTSVNLGEEETMVFRYVEPYGIASNPENGSEAILMAPHGSYEFAFVGLAADMTRTRPPLGKGETALYFSDKTFFCPRKDGTAEIQCEKGIRVRKGQKDLLDLLIKAFESIDSSSVAGQNKVTNPLLKTIVEQIKDFLSQ
jgi:phage gp45-like